MAHSPDHFDHLGEDGVTRVGIRYVPAEVIHACPPRGWAVMPCCDRTPFEVPRTDRLTSDYAAVTCGK